MSLAAPWRVARRSSIAGPAGPLLAVSSFRLHSHAKQCRQPAGSPPLIGHLAIGEIQRWAVARGLAGGSEAEFLHDFCTRCRQAGMSLSQAIVIIDTLHPTYEGRAFRWQAKPTNES